MTTFRSFYQVRLNSKTWKRNVCNRKNSLCKLMWLIKKRDTKFLTDIFVERKVSSRYLSMKIAGQSCANRPRNKTSEWSLIIMSRMSTGRKRKKKIITWLIARSTTLRGISDFASRNWYETTSVDLFLSFSVTINDLFSISLVPSSSDAFAGCVCCFLSVRLSPLFSKKPNFRLFNIDKAQLISPIRTKNPTHKLT